MTRTTLGATARLWLAALLPAGVCALGGCAINPGAAQLHLERGEGALARRDMSAALAEFREAVRLDPERPEAHEKLGLAYKQAGDLPRAAESLETAVRLDPLDGGTMYALGDVYQLLNDLTRAIRAYARVVQLSPKNFDAWSRLALCYHRTGELDRAVESYEAALKLQPRNAFIWFNLGVAQDSRGSQYEAIRAYKQSLECDLSQPLVLVNLATVYINQDRLDVARRTLETAVKLDPKLSVGHERLGYCHWIEGNLTEAAAHYGRAIELDGKNARAHFGLGGVRMTQYLNDANLVAFRDEAIEAWHRSLELDPNQPKVRELIEKYRIKTERPTLATQQ